MYPTINGTAAGLDLSYFFVYANSVTNGLFILLFVISFFVIVLVASLFGQLRITGRVKPETSFLAASFATIGLEVLLMQKNGLLSPMYFIISLAIFIISLIWVFLSSNDPYS